MRLYGQCMVNLPENPGELGAGDKGRQDLPEPDEFGGQRIGSRYITTSMFGNPEWVWTADEVSEWATDDESDGDLVDWAEVWDARNL